ncbi:MAG: tyrosine-type recombinase/integrase [Henriciella sp.]|nr:tyrosine-type recombinase/integrase [Henriciella sp.]
MSIFKRGAIYHYDFQYRGQRYRGSTGETTKRAAQDVEDKERRKAKLGRSTTHLTLREAALSWWDLHAQFLKSAANVDEGLKVCDRVLGFDKQLRDLTTRDLVVAVAKRREEVTQYGRPPSNATINREIPYIIRPILNHAVDVLGAKDAPSISWKAVILTKPKPKPREYSAAEMNALRDHLPAHLHALLDFYTVYGCRWNEAFFPLSHLDIEGGRIALRQRKGGDWHSIPLTESDRRKFAAAKSRAEAADLDTIWFRETSTGALAAITPRSFQRAMLKALKDAGITDARAVHDFRHHAAMQAMRRSGGRIAPVSKLLGHESIQTTQIYAHATEDDVRDILPDSPQNPHNEPSETDKYKGKTSG